eukprot:COSAG01_NODE_28927_length_649_cov_1.343636_1_plen_76_part_00
MVPCCDHHDKNSRLHEEKPREMAATAGGSHHEIIHIWQVVFGRVSAGYDEVVNRMDGLGSKVISRTSQDQNGSGD